MYEKLIKCAAETGFKIQSYIPRTREMKNRILSKINGACSSFFQKYINCPNITLCLPEKNTFFLPNLGEGDNCLPCGLPSRLLPQTPIITDMNGVYK